MTFALRSLSSALRPLSFSAAQARASSGETGVKTDI